MKAAMARIATALIGGALLAGCVSIKDHRGAVIDTQLAAAIQPGVDNKDSVAQMLGRPTFTGEFGDSDWYYVSRDTRTVAFRNPTVQKQSVLHIRFDSAGNVASMQTTGKELIAKIDPVNDRTPTLGRKRSLFEDLFGNIGTVNSPTVPGGSGGPY
ncbi:MAG: outer membrane protein assembly factor BamE [Sphingomicrobium sp.]